VTAYDGGETVYRRPRMLHRARLHRAVPALLAAACHLIAPRAEALDGARTLTQYVHRIWQTQQGLPQASIYAVLQTTDGQLWLGTQTGLVRFDGVRFTTVDPSNGVSVSDVWVTALAEDRDHALWIGTDASGVFRLHDGVLTHFTKREGLASDTVSSVFVDASGQAWVGTAEGLATWNGRSFTAFAPLERHPFRHVSASCVDPTNRVWVAHDDNLLDTWVGSVHNEHPISIAKSGVIRSLMCSREGGVWVGTTDGLIQIAPGHDRRFTTADGLASDDVLSLAESNAGAVLVGTTNGFSRIHLQDVESFRARDGLSQSAVYALYEDREGTLWVGTGHGLNQFLDGRTTPYTVSEGLPTNDTGPVLQDHAGTIWVGTLGKGLARFDGHRFATLTTRDGLASNTILALAADGADLWVGTDRGLNRIRDGRVQTSVTVGQGLPTDVVQALTIDARGVLWIATTGGAVTYRRGVIDRVVAPRRPLVALGAGPNGGMYLAPKDAGLQEDVDGQIQNPGDGVVPLRNVDAIYADRDGVVWLGTAGHGLLSIDHGRIVRYTIHDGLFDDSIYAILGDEFDRLWMACSKGIFFVDRAQLRRFAAGHVPKVTSTPFSPTDVLRTIECKPGVQPAAWRTADGRLWFSTTRGLLVLDSRNPERRFRPPPTAIDEVTVNGARSAIRGDLGSLAPGRNNVAFRYTGLSFITPARITFKYRLEGFDRAWVDAGTRREAFYTNLPPGRFRFRVAACNLENDCSEAAQAIAFEVLPRYYQRAWFIPLCLAGAAVVSIVGFRLHLRRLRERFALILTERARIARELHDTLIQGFSGITMAMQALTVRLPAGEERHRLEQIVADAGTALREARRSLFGLRRMPDAGSDLAAAIAQTSRQLTEEKGIRLQLQIGDWPDPLPPDVEYNLLRIVQEAVLNAVKHSGARTLMVALERTATRVRLLVKDDGAGFGDADRAREGHYGLVGMRERAAHIGADLQLETAPGCGTAVSLTLDA
jgi:ligand-binding sensor domain-containing protein/signal transduction histidine kinase